MEDACASISEALGALGAFLGSVARAGGLLAAGGEGVSDAEIGLLFLRASEAVRLGGETVARASTIVELLPSLSTF
jgi:hypothetical protein